MTVNSNIDPVLAAVKVPFEIWIILVIVTVGIPIIFWVIQNISSSGASSRSNYDNYSSPTHVQGTIDLNKVFEKLMNAMLDGEKEIRLRHIMRNNGIAPSEFETLQSICAITLQKIVDRNEIDDSTAKKVANSLIRDGIDKDVAHNLVAIAFEILIQRSNNV